MMIKVDSNFIVLDEEPEMVRQSKTPDLVDSAGDFSYQFDIPNTTENRNIIGIKGIYSQTFNVNAELTDDDGARLYGGILNIEGIDHGVMHASFIAGNSDWFTIIKDKKVFDIPLNFTEQWKVINSTVTPSAPLIAAWDNVDGIVFPLIDMGRNRVWGHQSLATPDFMPWAFVRNIMQAIFQSNGLSYTGDLFEDGLYNQLIVGVVSPTNNALPFYEGLGINVGKATNQSINTSSSVVSFTLTDFPYKVGSFGAWSVDTYTVPLAFLDKVSIDWEFSTTVTYTIDLVVNGIVRLTIEGTGGTVSKDFSSIGLAEGDTVQIKAKISSGSANIMAGSRLVMSATNLQYYYPQFLVGDMTQGDFVKSVFTMFNIISTYDQRTKTVTCSMFEKLTDKPTQDLSQYVSDYTIDTIEVLSDLAAQLFFKHQEGITQEVSDYNKIASVPFGGGVIEPNNRLLTDSKDFETRFTAGKDYYSNLLMASVIDTGGLSYSVDDSQNAFDSTQTDPAGTIFNTVDADGNPVAHGLNTGDFVNISGTTSGDYRGIGQVVVGAVNGLTDDQFRINRLDFISDTDGNWSRVTRTISSDSEHVYIAVYVPRDDVSNFSGLTQIRYNTTYYSQLPWAYFLKDSYGVPYDNLRMSPAFDKPAGNYSITLLETYYELYRRSIDNPIKVLADMFFPRSVYENIAFDRGVYLKTEDFTGTFFIQKIAGYVGSHKPCRVDLFKLASDIIRPIGSDSTPVTPPAADTSPTFVQNAVTTFAAGSQASITLTFSSNLLTDTNNRIYAFFPCRSFTGDPAGNVSVNVGSVESAQNITNGNTNIIMVVISGISGSHTSVIVSFATSNRPSDVEALSFEINHGTLGSYVSNGTSSASTSLTLNNTGTPGNLSMIITVASFDANAGFMGISAPSGYANDVTAVNSLQSGIAATRIWNTGDSDDQTVSTSNSVNGLGHSIEIVYTA